MLPIRNQPVLIAIASAPAANARCAPYLVLTAPRRRRDQHHHDRRGEHEQPRGRGVGAEAESEDRRHGEVERQDGHEPELDDADRERLDVEGQHRRGSQETQIDQRLGDAGLPPPPHQQHDHPGRHKGDHQRAGPPPALPLADHQQYGKQSCHQQDCPGPVDPSRSRTNGGFRHHQHAAEQGETHHDRTGPEQPVPRQRGHDRSRDEQPDSGAYPQPGAEQPERERLPVVGMQSRMMPMLSGNMLPPRP
jgi:hypothetical protein